MGDRLTRGLTQRMFLLSIQQTGQDWQFGVEGYSGTNYKVTISQSLVNCSCPDFYIRHKLCKHIFFIIGRIANQIGLTEQLVKSKSLSLTPDQYQKLRDGVKQKLSQRMEGGNAKPSSTDESTKINDTDDNCPICFEPLKGETMVQCVTTCKNYFHKVCMNIWLKKNQSCPLCRSNWSPKVSLADATIRPDSDELTYLSTVRLKPVIRLKRRNLASKVNVPSSEK